MNQRINYKSRFRILKGGKVSLVISAMIGSVTLGFAAPSGGVVTSGNATIVQTDKITNINQSTQKASINWQKFGIKAGETVNFNQPNSSSITLNRVIGNEKSVINGALNANGQVWILNSNGVLFGKNASVNTSGLLATTAKLSDIDFQNGNYNFTDTTSNSIINQGTIEVVNNGSVILASKEVKNQGTIKAVKGKIHLVGADSYSLNLNGNSLVNLKVDKGVLDAMVENSGTILSDGGEVYLTTNAVNELLKGVVNNTGVIEANSLDNLTGHVELFAHGGEVQIAGTLEVKDGFIETSGKEFTIEEGTKVNAGHWLIDPVNITIDTTLASTIEGQLASGDATVTTNSAGADEGNINVDSSIAWSTNTLTLHADNDININAALNATATAGLALEYAQTTSTGTYNVKAPINLAATGSFSTKSGSDAVKNYTIITSLGVEGSITTTDLQGINGDLSGNYVLGADIDASSTATWDSGEGWNPIGVNFSNQFTGDFDGLGHTVDGLTTNRTTTDYQALFGYTNTSASIKNIGVTNLDIKGFNEVGGLVGQNAATIQNSYAAVSVSGNDYYTGGLVGYNNGTIQNSYATGNINGTDSVGGLVGFNSHIIENSYATGTVNGTSELGGLIGHDNSGTVTDSYYDNETNTATMSDSATYGKTKEEIRTLAQASWDNSIWSAKGGGASVAGYEIVDLPYLIGVTRDADKSTTNATLFSAGMGTSANPYTITNWTQLQNINNSNILTNNYYFSLVNDLLTSTSGYTTQVKDGATLANTGTGWNPLGNNTNKFTGHFDGVNHTIDGLNIDRSGTTYQGLFGYLNTASTIKNIGVTNVDITGQNFVGGLVAYNKGTISNSYATGSVGGLVGDQDNGTISNSYAKVSASGTNYVGGLAGYEHEGTIENSYATGTVTGTSNVGGLVGYEDDGSIENSYASGTVTGTTNLGGLIGTVSSGTVTDSYYDNEANTATMNDSATHGKTKAELATLAQANWDIEEDNTVEKDKLFLAWEKTGKGYTKTWVVGTQEVYTPKPTTQNQTNSQNLENVITPIVNETLTKTNLPQDIEVQTNKLVSNKSTDKIVMLKDLQEDVIDTRATLRDNSLVSIVNGGVKLPIGLEQAFYSEEKR